MKEFLTQLFGEAVTDEAMGKINAEIGKRFVAKNDFNDKLNEIKILNGQISERDKQLKTLSETAGDHEELQKTIKQLQKDNETAKKEFQSQLDHVKFESALDKALLKAKAVDVDLVKVKLDRDVMKLSEDGTITGLEEQIETVKKDYGFLFGEKQSYKPAGGGDPKSEPTSMREALAERYEQNK